MAQLEKNFDRRPDPDALLALTDQVGGKLRVFLGAAPGVGKTYSMLAKARALKADGVDVVVGLVETHGRRETEALTEGLEILPRRKIDYRGRIIEEFDIDAALARKPKLIVVDELAHTNAPESRHPKRWQDVEELLDAGVDVWTALNIQHLESLADVVSRITGVAVRETVPDRVLQDAADVVLVDITPDELLQRLKEGKVYVPETAKRATQNFFTPGNLTALRELALRRTADRVDDQMVDYLRQNAIEGPWATSERLLVCVGGDVSADVVVRVAARLATGLNAAWTAVYVERLGHEEADPSRVKRVDDALRLAERLGASTERLSGHDLAGEVLRFARRENMTQIVVGRSRAGLLARLARRSLTDEIVRRSNDIAVYVVTEEQAKSVVERRPRSRPTRLELWIGMGIAALSVAITVGLGHVLELWLRLPNSVDDFSHPSDLLRGAVWTVGGDRRIGSFVFRFRFLLRRPSLRVHDFGTARILFAHRLSCRRRHNGNAREPYARSNLLACARGCTPRSPCLSSRANSRARPISTTFCGPPPSMRRRRSMRDVSCC